MATITAAKPERPALLLDIRTWRYTEIAMPAPEDLGTYPAITYIAEVTTEQFFASALDTLLWLAGRAEITRSQAQRWLSEGILTLDTNGVIQLDPERYPRPALKWDLSGWPAQCRHIVTVPLNPNARNANGTPAIEPWVVLNVDGIDGAYAIGGNGSAYAVAQLPTVGTQPERRS